jgi:drug/metabolite transporter (DMT)-like permease
MSFQLTEKKYTLAGFAAILLWSTAVAFSRSVSESLGPLTAVATIYLTGGVFGLLAQSRQPDFWPTLRALNRRYLLGCGSLFIIYLASFYLALGRAQTRHQVLEVGLLNYLWPMLTLLFAVPLLKMRARIWLIPGALLATLGAFLALIPDAGFNWISLQQNLHDNFTPYALGLVAAISWALYSVLSRKWGRQIQSGGVFLFMFMTGLVLGAARLVFPETSTWNFRVLLELGYLIIGTNLAYFFWEISMRKGDLALVVSVSWFTPLLSTLVSVLYLGVRAGWKLWIAAGFIVIGAIISKKSVNEPQ